MRARDTTGLLVVLATLVMGFSLATDHFFSTTTFRALANQAPDALLVAAGLTFVLVAGDIDLSVGSTLALSSATLGIALTRWAWPMPAAFALAVATGAAVGLVNGALSVRWALPSFIVTLGTLEAARGATYLVTDSQTIYLGPAVETLLTGVAGGLGLPFFLALAVLVSGDLVLTRTVFGRHVVAVGSNPAAARAAGVATGRVRVLAFVLCGALAGVAATVQAARLSAADPNAGTGAELQAIAAAVIGGTSLLGGRGSVMGTAIGVAIIVTLGAGLAQMGVEEPTRRIITGAVIVGAAVADWYRRRTS